MARGAYPRTERRFLEVRGRLRRAARSWKSLTCLQCQRFRSSAGMSLSSASASTPQIEDMSSPCDTATLCLNQQQWVRLFFHLSTSLLKTIRRPLHPLCRWAVQGCLLFPQGTVALQVSWRDSFSSLPSLVQPEALKDDGFSRLSFLQRFVEFLTEESFSVFLVPFLCQFKAFTKTQNSFG